MCVVLVRVSVGSGCSKRCDRDSHGRGDPSRADGWCSPGPGLEAKP